MRALDLAVRKAFRSSTCKVSLDSSEAKARVQEVSEYIGGDADRVKTTLSVSAVGEERPYLDQNCEHLPRKRQELGKRGADKVHSVYASDLPAQMRPVLPCVSITVSNEIVTRCQVGLQGTGH